ncbi:MAG: N-acetylglucosamine kinase [Opitutaceae bacterium]
MNYRLGVDGGGTKTEAVLVEKGGAEVARRIGPGCNPSIVGTAESKRVVAELIRGLLAPTVAKDPALRIDTTLLCMAGSRGYWQEFAGGLVTFGHVVAVDDSLPVLELATGGGPGLVLHAGTGSFVAARSGKPSTERFGDVHYAGGLGWRFGDPGSGYDLGRDAIARGMLELQGWLPPSGIGPFLKEHTGLPEAGAISRFFYNDSVSNPKIAQLAPGILELAGRGDEAAREIVTASAGHLLDLGLRVAAKLFPGTAQADIPAGLSGPILNHPFVRETLAARSPLKFRPITAAPIEGVKTLLARMP